MTIDVGTAPRQGAQLSREQQGLIFAALVAFLGVGFIGPVIAGLRDRNRLRRYAKKRVAAVRQTTLSQARR